MRPPLFKVRAIPAAAPSILGGGARSKPVCRIPPNPWPSPSIPWHGLAEPAMVCPGRPTGAVKGCRAQLCQALSSRSPSRLSRSSRSASAGSDLVRLPQTMTVPWEPNPCHLYRPPRQKAPCWLWKRLQSNGWQSLAPSPTNSIRSTPYKCLAVSIGDKK